MKILTIDASYNGEVVLSEETLNYIKDKGYNKIALYGSVQFVKHLNSVKEQLKDYEVVTTKASRTHVEGQLLGCDVYENNLKINLEVDCFLYIGDGFFHPKALLFAQKERKDDFKEILMYDPIGKTFRRYGPEDNKVVMGKLKGNLMKLLACDTLGFIATIKPGQSFFYLKDKLISKFPKKKIYVFLTDNISEGALEAFPFIDVWVNSACPRLGLDDAEHMNKNLVNIADALDVENVLSKL